MSFVDRFLRVRGYTPEALAAARDAHAAGTEDAPAIETDRRAFIAGSLATGGGLVIAMSGVGTAAAALVGEDGAMPAGFAPNAFIRIAVDGAVTLVAKHDEMGQGIHTGLAITICEELEVDLDQVTVEPAPAAPPYANSAWGVQVTGGSSSTYSSFEQMRQAGAVARTMLVAAAAARWGVDPSECEAVKGTVRRRGDGASLTYGELATEASTMPVPETVPLKSPDRWTKIGKPTSRVDSPAKVRGQAPFSLDVTLPGMLTAMVERCPYPGGSLRAYDAGAARGMPGVRKIVTVPSGVAVIADGYWNAYKARKALKVDWDKGRGVVMDSRRLRNEFRSIAEQPGIEADAKGDAEAALANAETRLDAIYEVPYQAHAPMEPLSCMVELQSDGGAILHTGSQMLGADVPAVAARLGVAPDRVSLKNNYLGGGFGRRANPASDFILEAVEVAIAARDLGAPIKTIWSREDDIRGEWYRPMYANKMSAAIEDGRLVGWRHRIVGQSIAAGTAFEPLMIRNGVDGLSIEGAAHQPYAIPNSRVELHSVDLPVKVQWWRAVGHTNTAYAKEGFLDEVAESLGRDPYEYRRELLADHPRHLRVLDHVAEKAGWSNPLPAGVGRGIAVHESFLGFAANVIEASVEQGRVKIHRVVCAIDCGPVVNPDQVIAQMQSSAIFALSGSIEGEITYKDGRVEQSNFNDFKVLRMHETPPIEVHIVESDDAMGGVGEVGVPPIASALCSAIRDAGGPRIRRLPIGDQLG